MRSPTVFLGVLAALAATLPAQSPLNTMFAQNASIAAGGGVFFDLTVAAPVTITQFDCNLDAVAGSIDVYTIGTPTSPGTHSGNEINAAPWTLVASAPVVGLGPDVPAPAVFTTPFTLQPGTYGIAIIGNGVRQYYTNTGSRDTFANGELSLLSGASMGIPFTFNTINQPRVWNGAIHYTLPPGFAWAYVYGTGCPDQFASFYEVFPGTMFDLSGTAGSENVIQMTFTGAGYLVGAGTPAWFTPTSPNLGLGDDANSAPQTLPFALNYPGGTTNQVIIGSNGYVFLGAGTSTSPFYWGTVLVPGLLSEAARLAPFWGDLDPSSAGTVHFDVDPSGLAAYATWDQVPEWNVPGAISSFQVAMFAGGSIEYRYQICTISVAFPVLTGWTPGGNARDPGSIDLSAALPASFITLPDQAPLDLSVSARPIQGTTINLITNHIPANAPIAALILSFTQHDPGLSLAGIGMNGCFQYVGLDSTQVIFAPTPTTMVPLAVPTGANFTGLNLWAQTAAFAPGFNPLGVIASNGQGLVFGLQ